MTIWFASGNAHKRQELEAIFPGHIIKIPNDEGLAFDPEENGSAFFENSLLKARALYRLLRDRDFSGPVIADDSGLCVDALDGRPGIYSARYGSIGRYGSGGQDGAESGKKLDAAERNALLLEELGDNPNRKARFVCAMVLLWSEDRFYAVQETMEGELTRVQRGSSGFGYDPILLIPEKGCTVAELSGEEKSRLSHRGKAGYAIAKLLAE
jgi:XTP/dITP diphosphohydrolase